MRPTVQGSIVFARPAVTVAVADIRIIVVRAFNAILKDVVRAVLNVASFVMLIVSVRPLTVRGASTGPR